MKGVWIKTAPEVETPLFERRFSCEAGASASITLCGLGWFELRLNGRRIGQDLFTPAQTNYGPRDLSSFSYTMTDRMSYRAYTLTYDLTSELCEGENCLQVLLGNGWFRQKERVCEGYTAFGDSLLLCYEMTLEEAGGERRTLCSDGSERCFCYPITYSNIYGGEDLDTTLFDAPLTETAVMTSDFDTTLYPQACPPDRVIRTLEPRLLWRRGDTRLYDAGENLSGYVTLDVQGDRGEVAELCFAEALDETENLCFSTSGSDCLLASGRPQIQRDRFVLNGREQRLHPTFVFHGFRYFTLTCHTEKVRPTVQVIHTDLPVTASFSCDDGVLNWLYEAYLRSQLSNFHGCVPSDCPHRERLGYTGDGQACAEAAMLTLDSLSAYEKWLEDILDSADRVSGHIKHTAPFMGGGGGPGGWGCAVAILPDRMLERSGDWKYAARSYDAILHWISYLQAHCEGDIVTSEEAGGWCLGDWCTPEPVVIPEPFVNTCYYIHTLSIAARFSRHLGKGDEGWLEEQADRCREALSKRYGDGEGYCGGCQGADAYAIWAGLAGRERTLARLIDRYAGATRLDTGFLGTDLLCGVLFDAGRGDIALRLLASRDGGVGFGRMMTEGATTLYEYLNNNRHSRNHPMFGACARHLFTGLLGIRNREGRVGYTDLVITPCLSSHVSRASGSIACGEGILSVSFDREAGWVEVDLPRGVSATLCLPTRRLALQTGKSRIDL